MHTQNNQAGERTHTKECLHNSDASMCPICKPINDSAGIIFVRGIQCRVTKILPLGTIEAVSLDGNRAFRVSGLSMV